MELSSTVYGIEHGYDILPGYVDQYSWVTEDVLKLVPCVVGAKGGYCRPRGLSEALLTMCRHADHDFAIAYCDPKSHTVHSLYYVTDVDAAIQSYGALTRPWSTSDAMIVYGSKIPKALGIPEDTTQDVMRDGFVTAASGVIVGTRICLHLSSCTGRRW